MDSVKMCKSCMTKLNIKNQLDEGIETHKRNLVKLGKYADVEAIIEEMENKRKELLQDIDTETKGVCFFCKFEKDLNGGAIIEDWKAFVDNILDSMKELRKLGKETGKNVLPLHKYMAVKIALKASKYIFVKGGGQDKEKRKVLLGGSV